MKKFFLIALTAFFVLFSTTLTVLAAQEKGLASLNKLTGGIKYSKNSAEKYVELNAKDAMALSLGEGALIMTGPETRGELFTTYGAVLSVEANTELQIGFYNIRIMQGGIWVNYKPVKGSDGSMKFKVQTPVGTIGIKGTIFGVVVDLLSKETSVQVKEGVVSFETPDKKSVDIAAGTKLDVLKDAILKTPEKFEIKRNIVTEKLKKNAVDDKNEDSKEASIESVKKSLDDPFNKFKGKDPKKQ
ncbi:MAG TPA: FecR domain-containing protein [Candidatus Wallbacteria bacterium]|nr:FecR domain-containing protein [Candidatus Wallbacteria bacterium]